MELNWQIILSHPLNTTFQILLMPPTKTTLLSLRENKINILIKEKDKTMKEANKNDRQFYPVN